MVNHYLTNLNIGNTDMKLYDRMLLLKRAVIVACNPDTESVQIVYTDKNKSITSNHIASDVDHMKKLYIEHMVSMFTDNTKSAESLHNICLTFMNNVQTKWNDNHPDDLLSIIQPIKRKYTRAQTRVKNIMENNKDKDFAKIKIVLFGIEDDYESLYGEDLSDTILKIEKFYADMDTLFYKYNKITYDNLFADQVKEFACSWVLFESRKTGNMPDHTFNILDLYDQAKIIRKYFKTF